MQQARSSAPLFATPETTKSKAVEDDIQQVQQRLRSMAAKLRAEASELESQQAKERADVTGRAFRKFDKNNDGEISLDELKASLEATFKIDLPATRVEQLMASFDTSGDGKLQKDEFVGVEQFRNKLESLARDEKANERATAKAAEQEAALATAMEVQLELINDKPPTGTDKIVSVVPYLLPLIDGAMLARVFLEINRDNPVVTDLAVLYTIYQSIPLGGFISFFALNIFSGNLSINRMVRFNMQQAIYLDIALFVPGLIAALSSAASSGLGLEIPAGVTELGSDAVFLALVATIGYSAVSSLLGSTPDKIPFLSDATNNRVPKLDDLLDSEGRFDPTLMQRRNNKEKDTGNDNK